MGTPLIRRWISTDRKSTRLNSSHTEIYTLSLHDALPIYSSLVAVRCGVLPLPPFHRYVLGCDGYPLDPTMDLYRSEEHTSELQSHRDLHSFPTRRSSDLFLSSCGAVRRVTTSAISSLRAWLRWVPP